jgi:hypothetical protein
MTSASRARRPQGERSLLDSPWLAALLALVVIGLAAAIVLPGFLGVGGPSATATLAAGAASPTPVPAPTFLRPTPSPQPTFVAYVVKSGDTLNSIAKHFDTTARSIAWWSRGLHPSLDPESAKYQPNRLEVGWVLQVVPGTEVDENNPPTIRPDS